MESFLLESFHILQLILVNQGSQIHFGMEPSDPGYGGQGTWVDDHGNLRNASDQAGVFQT
jgi:hypothetical protein